ncbi:MAG: transposase [Pyrinomonadaceae bacterium]
MKINCLKRHSAATIKALFGLKPKVLAEVMFLVLPELERCRTERLQQRAKRKRAFIAHDGRPREVQPYQKLLMCLLYLRHNTSHEVIGRMFSFSADTAENAFAEVLPLLRDLFPNQKWEAERRHRRGEEKWTPAKVERVIIDSFETPIRRPSNNDRQKRYYSGKKKRHTLKTQIATDHKGAVLCVGNTHRGPQADIKVYEEDELSSVIKEIAKLGDKAYCDQKHPEIVTPHKKPKGKELTEEQRAENKLLASQRVYVEHGIRRVKGFRIVRDEYRMAVGLFGAVTSAVVGLIQFSQIVG